MSAAQHGPSRQQRRQAERDARRKARRGPGHGVDGPLDKAVRAHVSGDAKEAEAGYRRQLAAEPDDPAALRLLGLLLDQRTQLSDVLNGLPAGTATEARRGDAAYQTALALAVAGRLADAERTVREAVTVDGTHGPALILLADLRRRAGALDEAAALARRAVGATDSWAAHRQLGLALAGQERVIEAITPLRRATALAPNDAEGWLALGNVLLTMGELAEALDAFERTRDLEPRAAATHNNVAITNQRMGRYREAVAASAKALELEPDNHQYRFNRAFGLLGSGDLAKGWELFDDGFLAGGRAPRREFPVPAWDGTPQPDKALLVWREQGVGDEIRFASCYADAAARVGRIVIETDPRLVSLFSRSFPDATVRPQTTGPAEPDVDLHVPAGSLPRYLRRSLDDFPAHDGYLSVDRQQAARFRERLDALGPGLKVGVSWRSMNLGVGRLGHYTVLDEWEAVARVPGVVLVNLQYGVPEQVEAELAAFRERTGITIHRWDDVDYTNDFEAVAALVDELDVVAGVGTTPALLAGALGRPALMLALPDPLTFGGEGYPWLPSLRRVPKAWDEPWSGPIATIADTLGGLAAARQG